MRILFCLPLVVLLFSGCMQPGKNIPSDSAGDNTAIKSTDTLCFERYTGQRKQDTASIRLIIEGDQVTGHFSNLPYEKDARIGTLSGTKKGNIISGTWLYQQEGMTDSLNFEFLLKGDQLLQKKSVFDQNTGRETISDTDEFSESFDKINCRNSNSRARVN